MSHEDYIKELEKDRARLDWLEAQGNGLGVVHDDQSQWAVAMNGMQSIRSLSSESPAPLDTTYFVEGEAFRNTIREAIDAAMAREEVTR